MAEESGVTEEGLKATLIEKLQATHVEIQDISGSSCAPPFYFPLSHCLPCAPYPSPISCPPFPFHVKGLTLCPLSRRLRPSLQRPSRISPIPEENHPRPTSTCQHHSKNRDRGYSCVDAEVLYAGGVGEVNRERGGPGGAGEGHDGGGCGWDYCVKIFWWGERMVWVGEGGKGW
jgi:hypothetical protein